MKRQEDSFEDIAFELEKQTYKSKLLPFMVVAIVVFSVIGTVFLTLSLSEKSKAKQTPILSSQISSSSNSLEDEKAEAEQFVKSLIVSPEKSEPFLWTVEKAIALPMNKYKGGAVLEDVLKEFGKPVQGGAWIEFLPNHEVQKRIRLIWKSKNGSMGYVSLTFAEFDGVYKLISKYHFSLSSDKIQVDNNPKRSFLWTQAYIDSLVIGAREGTDKGTPYDEIVLKVGLPLHQTISGDDNQLKMRVDYVNPDSWQNPEQLKRVHLEFSKQEDGRWRLVSKEST